MNITCKQQNTGPHVDMEEQTPNQPGSVDQVLSLLSLHVSDGIKQLKTMFDDLRRDRDSLKERVSGLELQNAQLLHNNNELVKIIEELQNQSDHNTTDSKLRFQHKASVSRITGTADQALIEGSSGNDTFTAICENSGSNSINQGVFLDTNNRCMVGRESPPPAPLEQFVQDESLPEDISGTGEDLVIFSNDDGESQRLDETNSSQPRRNLLSCTECDMTFSSISELDGHSRTHNSEKPYLCVECGHRFTLFGSLKRHLEGHAGKKVYHCDKCGLRFTRLHNLKRHEVLHSQGVVFKCDYCARKYPKSDQLEKHLLTHSSIKKFPCAVCGRGFASAASLKTHMRSHSDKKPYKCKTCGVAFSRMAGLRDHMIIHEPQQLSCENCNLKFDSVDLLATHSQTHNQLTL